MYDKAKKIVRKDVCVKFYYAARLLYLKTNTLVMEPGYYR